MTGADAIAYVRAKLADWQQVPARINAAIQRGSQLARAAQLAGDRDREAKAIASMQRLAGLMALYRETAGKVVDLLAKIAGVEREAALAGFGIAPILLVPLLGAAALVVAGAMGLVYKKLEQERAELDAVERGIIPPEKYKPENGGGFLPDLGGAIGGTLTKAVLPLALIAGGLLVARSLAARGAGR